MPNVELTEQDLADLRAMQEAKAAPPRPKAPPRRPQDRKAKAAPPRIKQQQAAPADGPRDFSPTAWGSKIETTDLQVPSGQWCKVRQVEVHELVSAGLLDNVDSLSNIVQNELVADAEGRPSIDPAQLGKNMNALRNLMDVTNRFALFAVVEPKLSPIPYDEDGVTPLEMEERETGKVYVDQIGLEDKTFIMQFVMGGVRELEQFREG